MAPMIIERLAAIVLYAMVAQAILSAICSR
jgi:hypothetical protein